MTHSCLPLHASTYPRICLEQTPAQLCLCNGAGVGGRVVEWKVQAKWVKWPGTFFPHFLLGMLNWRFVHTTCTPQLRCGVDISITSLPQINAASQHFKFNFHTTPQSNNIPWVCSAATQRNWGVVWTDPITDLKGAQIFKILVTWKSYFSHTTATPVYKIAAYIQAAWPFQSIFFLHLWSDNSPNVTKINLEKKLGCAPLNAVKKYLYLNSTYILHNPQKMMT